MLVKLKGVHSVRVKRKDGGQRVYHYAWRGGPRLAGEPGSAAFIASYQDAHASLREAGSETVGGLVALYKGSAAFAKLADSTKRDCLSVFKLIEDEFGSMRTRAALLKDARKEFLTWRDSFAANPRKADRCWSVFKRVFSYAKEQGEIPHNPCEGGGKLWNGSRRESIWTEADIIRFQSVASDPMAEAMRLALATGQRQGDLLAMTWSAYDGERVRLTQSKTGRKVAILLADEDRAMLDAMRARNAARDNPSTHVLTGAKGNPWTRDGFKTVWGRTTKKAGVTGLTFHDLRGTAITRARREGASYAELSSRFGYSEADVEAILTRHYLAESQGLGDAIVLRRRTKAVKLS